MSVRTRNGAFNRWYCIEWKAPSFVNMFREAFEAGQTEARASERQRIRDGALAHWRKVHAAPGYLPKWFADLLDGDGDEG